MESWKQRRDEHGLRHVIAYDIETIVAEEPADGSFPPLQKHQPVAAAFLEARQERHDHYDFTLKVITCTAGEEARFIDKVSAALPVGATGVGWNTRGFDNIVLKLRAMKARIFSAEGLARQTEATRFSSTHADLADLFSGYGGARTMSLAAVCELLQIPVKTSVDGSDVGKLWRAGDVRAIKQYVCEDVIATYICWLHYAAWHHCDAKLLSRPLAALADWIESIPDLAHLKPFAICPPAIWAREQVAHLREQSALADLQRLQQRVRDEEAFSAR